MTGTQSLSIAQLDALMNEVGRLEIAARRSRRYHNADQGRVYTGQPVTIDVHQAEPFVKADKRVDIHLAFSNSVTFWLDRNGAKYTLSEAPRA